MLQTLEALDAWALTLSETAHTDPSNKTFHTRVLYRPRSGMWQRDKIKFCILGAFPLKKRAADFLIESRSAPLRIGKSPPARFHGGSAGIIPHELAVQGLLWLTGA